MRNIEMKRVFSLVPNIVYRNGALEDVTLLLPGALNDSVIVLKDNKVNCSLPKTVSHNLVEYDFDRYGEPKSDYVNELFNKCVSDFPTPSAILSIGGGSVMDIGKAISVLYTNNGYNGITEVQDLQGWNLVPRKGIYKVGVPTIFGSGAEASRTAVLKMETGKLGINSEFSQFDAIVIDPMLASTVDPKSIFFSAMDCYIHCVESLMGCYKNTLAQTYAMMGLKHATSFLDKRRNFEDIAIGSYFGGVSIVNSEVGVCHALSYGISKVFGINHGEANCIIFQNLDKFYGKYCVKFRKYLKDWDIPLTPLPRLDQKIIDEMILIALRMERPLENALGQNYKKLDLHGMFEKVYQEL